MRHKLQALLGLGIVVVVWPSSAMAQGSQSLMLNLMSPQQALPGDMVSMNVTGVQSGAVGVGGSMFQTGIPSQVIKHAPPYSFAFQIPVETSAGNYDFSAFELLSDGSYLKSNEVSIYVGTVQTVTSLSIDPNAFILRFRGDARPLKVYGNVAQGQEDLTGDATTICRSADPTVIEIMAPCNAIAIETGATSISISGHGLTTSISAHVELSVFRGDFNGDGVVDQTDIQLLTLQLNKPAQRSGDDRDLNGDGKIDALDARILTTLCTYPHCATYP